MGKCVRIDLDKTKDLLMINSKQVVGVVSMEVDVGSILSTITFYGQKGGTYEVLQLRNEVINEIHSIIERNGNA